MSVKSLNRAATNRSTVHSGRVAAATSPYERLRHALEWVMAEARAMDRAEVPAVVDRISGVARDLNERSRP
ncbi:hypothetical protein AB0J14_04900 [Micromonospora arborensis]|uniref:hypothetical protein n=1 Tax=Micromonospora arborensis TaxID=2116518 RepID=UPI0033CFA552